MAIQREHCIQKHARLWAREALSCKHLFLAFDRSKAASRYAHLYEKNRGIVAGTPDTLLIIPYRIGIWCEFKSPGNEPTDTQKSIGASLIALGQDWFWCTSVDEYRLMLSSYNVPMHPSSLFLAMHHDGLVKSEIAKAEAKKGVVPKAARKPRTKTNAAMLTTLRKSGFQV